MEKIKLWFNKTPADLLFAYSIVAATVLAILGLCMWHDVWALLSLILFVFFVLLLLSCIWRIFNGKWPAREDFK